VGASDPQPVTAGPPLKLEIKLNRQLYTLGEPVVATFTITNVGTRDREDVWFSYDNTLYIAVEDQAGETVELYGNLADTMLRITWWRRRLPPSASVTTTMDVMVGDVVEVSPFFLRGEFADFMKEPLRVSQYALTPGSYTFRAAQAVGRALHSSLDIVRPEGQATVRDPNSGGRLRATAPFEVRKPTDQEQAALELFKLRPALESYGYPKVAQSQQDALEAYQTLIQKYPETPCAPYAQYYSGRILQVQKKFQEAAKAYEALLKKHPQFPLRADALYYLVSCYAKANEKAKGREVLQTLKKEFLNHLIAPTVPYQGKMSRVEAIEQELKEQ
jgi:hypothetical protein